MSSPKNQPAAPTAAKHTDATSKNQDGSAAYSHNSTDLATIAAALIRIADELHRLNWTSTPRGPRYITRQDDTDNVGPAHTIAEKRRL